MYIFTFHVIIMKVYCYYIFHHSHRCIKHYIFNFLIIVYRSEPDEPVRVDFHGHTTVDDGRVLDDPLHGTFPSHGGTGPM